MGLVNAGSVQLSASNIRVNGVAPGATQSSLLTNSQYVIKGDKFHVTSDEKTMKESFAKYISDKGVEAQQQYYYNRVAQPDEIANIGVFLASSLSSAVNGQVIIADSGKTAGALGESYIGAVPAVKPLDLN
jgi:NAD(P)-dependent dehydrogenase (short-subunit alcohol dehydrogenase family)